MKRRLTSIPVLMLLTAIFCLIPGVTGILRAEISMKEAVEKGIQMNASYQNHVLETESLVLQKQNAEKRKWFSVESAASYIFKSEQMEIVFPDSNPAPGITIPGISKTAGAKHNFDFKLGVTQPIYTGDILSNNIKLEAVKAAIEKNKATLSKMDAAAAVKTSYFNYRLLIFRRESIKSLIKQLNLHYEKLKRFYQEDLVRKSDLLETEAKISEQLVNLEELNLAIQQETVNFKKLCGFDIDKIDSTYQEKIKDMDAAFVNFKTRHPVLQTMEQRIAALETGKKIVKGQYLPQVGAFAELHYGKPGLDFFKNEWSLYFQGGVSINMKLFDWNKKKRDLRISDYGIQKIKNEKNDFIRDGQKHLQQLYDARGSAEKQLETVEKLITITAEDIHLKEQMVTEHQISNIDYLGVLTKKERYVSMKNTIEAQLALVKININKLTAEDAK